MCVFQFRALFKVPLKKRNAFSLAELGSLTQSPAMEGEHWSLFCLLFFLLLPSRLSWVSGSKLYCDVNLLVRRVSYRQKCELGKGWREKRQPICLIQRRPSIGWWEGEGNPIFTFKRVVPPSYEVQSWKTAISVWVGWGHIWVPSGCHASQLASVSSLHKSLHCILVGEEAALCFPFGH